MRNLRIKIEKLKGLLEEKLRENNYVTNEEIVRISQELDEYIVIFQKKYQNKKVVQGISPIFLQLTKKIHGNIINIEHAPVAQQDRATVS